MKPPRWALFIRLTVAAIFWFPIGIIRQRGISFGMRGALIRQANRRTPCIRIKSYSN